MIQSLFSLNRCFSLKLSYFDISDQETAKSLGSLFGYIGAGQSMVPAINSKQNLEITPQNSFAKNDVVVFLENGRFVCHRVTACLEGGYYQTKGDGNNFLDAELISAGQIVGKVCSVRRGRRNKMKEWAFILLRFCRAKKFLRSIARNLISSCVRLYVAQKAPVKLFNAYRFVSLSEKQAQDLTVALLFSRCIGIYETQSKLLWVHKEFEGLGLEEQLKSSGPV